MAKLRYSENLEHPEKNLARTLQTTEDPEHAS